VRWLILAAGCLAAAAAVHAAARSVQWTPPSPFDPLGLLGLASLGAAALGPALAYPLAERPHHAPGALGAAGYAVACGAGFLAITFTWGRHDNAFLGTALLGLVLVLLGGTLAARALATLRDHPQLTWPARRGARLGLAAIVAAGLTVGLLILAGPDDWATRSRVLKLYSLPTVAAGTAVGYALLRLGRAPDEPVR
jgi:hypothetical protein